MSRSWFGASIASALVSDGRSAKGLIHLLEQIRSVSSPTIVVNWAGENDNRGLALAGVDGSLQVLDLPAGATLLGVPAASTLFGASGVLRRHQSRLHIYPRAVITAAKNVAKTTPMAQPFRKP